MGRRPKIPSEYYDYNGDGEDELYDDFDITYDDDPPECCVACGGPYPDCMSSCPIFDD